MDAASKLLVKICGWVVLLGTGNDVLDYDINAIEFKPQWRYYVNFRTNTFRKLMIFLIPFQ